MAGTQSAGRKPRRWLNTISVLLVECAPSHCPPRAKLTKKTWLPARFAPRRQVGNCPVETLWRFSAGRGAGSALNSVN